MSYTVSGHRTGAGAPSTWVRGQRWTVETSEEAIAYFRTWPYYAGLRDAAYATICVCVNGNITTPFTTKDFNGNTIALEGNYYAQYDITYFDDVVWCNPANTGAPSTTDYDISDPFEVHDGWSLDDAVAAARVYFDTPPTPYMDVDIYTEPPIVTVLWDNITNYPADMYPSSYYVRLRVGSSAAHQLWTIALCPYSIHQYSADWRDILNNTTDTTREECHTQGYFYLRAQLGYLDPEFLLDEDHLRVVNSCIFKIDITDGTVTVEDSGDGNTCTPHTDTSPESDDTYTGDGGSIATESAGLDLSVDNLLTSSYKLSEAELQGLGNFLWTNNLQGQIYENQVSPIENIISCKRIPFSVSTTGTPTQLYLGNIPVTGLNSVQRTSDLHVLDCGTLTMQTFSGNFLDFTNNISIYLPYCGIHSIPTGLCYSQGVDSGTGLPTLTGRSLGVKYYYDIIYGSCAAVLSMDGATFAVYNGSCGVDIPLSQSSRAATQLEMSKAGDNMVLGVTNTITNAGMSALNNAFSGNIGGIFTAGASGMVNAVTQRQQYEIEKSHQQLHYTTSGGFSSQVASYLPSDIIVFYDHIKYKTTEDEPGTYAHESGFPCFKSYVLGKLKGYTELDGSIEISDIPCLDEERALLKQALVEGFYMQKDPDPSLP